MWKNQRLIVLQNGKKIFPEEIEEILNKIDGVKESLVFDKNNEKDNNKINAIIVYNEYKFKQKSQIEIKKFLMNKIKEINESLPNYKTINDITITSDLLERTSTGKIKRQKEKMKQINKKNKQTDISIKNETNFEKIKKILTEKPEIQEITEESNTINDLGADSLDLVEIFLKLEKEFNIKLPRQGRKNIVTVKDILDIVTEYSKILNMSCYL